MVHWLKRSERGQSMVEVAVVSVFFMILAIMIYEAGVVFSTYTVLLNASREGGIYASAHPELASVTSVPTNTAVYQEYLAVTATEASSLPGWVDRDSTSFQIERPVLIVTNTSTGEQGLRVRVRYNVRTFTSTISLPFFGRMGLPNYWPISAWTIMPAR